MILASLFSLSLFLPLIPFSSKEQGPHPASPPGHLEKPGGLQGLTRAEVLLRPLDFLLLSLLGFPFGRSLHPWHSL
jgi:hypothetical protein